MGSDCAWTSWIASTSSAGWSIVSSTTHRQDPGAWSQCTDDGKGKYFQSKVLGVKTPAQFNGAACPAETDPKRLMKRFCPPINCTPFLPEEDFREFGPCTNDGSGKFYKSKILGVKDPAENGGTCLENDRVYKVLCPPIDCVPFTPEEDSGDFGPCVDNGKGTFYRSKILGIKVPPQNGGDPCPPNAQLTVRIPCADPSTGPPHRQLQ